MASRPAPHAPPCQRGVSRRPDCLAHFGGNGGGTRKAITGLASSSKFNFWSLTVPTGTTRLVVRVSGGGGDADLYVWRGESVSGAANCVSTAYLSNGELCSFDAPATGLWTIGVRGSYSGVTLAVNPIAR